MLLSLATATAAGDPAKGKALLAALALLAVLVYAGSCVWFPFGKCRKCKGSGRVYRKDGKVFRRCKRCKYTGRRLRVGRVVWNFIHKRRRKGTRHADD